MHSGKQTHGLRGVGASASGVDPKRTDPNVGPSGVSGAMNRKATSLDYGLFNH